MTALILGGYGNFGKRIAELLVRSKIPVVIAGRDRSKATALRARLPVSLVDVATFDVNTELAAHLKTIRPQVVINTCGPFQNADYGIAKTCIANGVHYID